VLLTPQERTALLTLVSLLILGQLASIWSEHRRERPDRELSAWLTRLEAVRADTAAGVASMSNLAAGLDWVMSREPKEEGAANDDGPAAESAVEPRDRAGAPAVEPLAAAPPGLLETGRIRVNRASARDLEALPGIGPVMAKRILEERDLHGPFRRPEDLLRVKGIGPKTLARLADRFDYTP
jgi:competence protein ComEA